MPNDSYHERFPGKKRRKKQEATEFVIMQALRSEPELHAGNLFRLDTFSGQTLLMHPIPVPGITPPKHWEPVDTTDVHIGHLLIWLQSNNFTKASVSRVGRAIDIEADRNKFSAAKQALDELPKWDGKCRLDTFWIDVCGAAIAEQGMDQQDIRQRQRYLSATARCFFISIVARILRPGCKVDTMPVLEGPQGTLKSSLLRVIAFDRDEWLSDSMSPDLASKDAKSHLAGKLIVELSEMQQMKGTRSESLKNFLSAQDDKFRPSYGRRDIIQKRQCVFVGTTNHGDYLRDETGNRRFWPIQCSQIDIMLAREIMPQLYAEAKQALLANEEQWWLPSDVEFIAEIEQDNRLTADPWEDGVKTVIDGRRNSAAGLGEGVFWVSTTDALSAIEVDRAKWDSQKQDRVQRILRKYGGKNKRLPRHGSSQKWAYCFVTGKNGADYTSQKPRYSSQDISLFTN
jgi:predicted P-loop ATPase